METTDEVKIGTNQTEIKNGRFTLAVNADGAFLTVFPPQDGNPVTEPEIITALKAQNVANFTYSLVIKALKEATGSPVKIYSSAQHPAEPAIQVLVERDRMEAFILITAPPNSRAVTTAEVLAKIESSGVRYGVDIESVKRACQHPGPKYSVAKGLSPIDGQDARIIYLFNLEKKAKPHENEDGTVDFKNIGLFTTAHEGDTLAEKLPPVLGKPGIDVLGNSIPPKPGRDIPLPLGKNVKAEGSKVVAAISGQVLLVNGKIQIAPVLVVNGDVDFSSGNIEFVGSVTIKGTVQPGFHVKADGDIEIQGSVSGGIVEGRNVMIRTGIQGMLRGHVKASQNVTAKFIENSNVIAGDTVYVNDVVLHSRVSAKHKVIVEGRRGLIVGGQVCAGEEIRAKAIGTQLAVATDLEVGINPMLREEYQALRKEIRKVESTLDQTQKSVQLLRSMESTGLPPAKHELLLKLTKAQFQLSGQVETMRKRINEFEDELEQMRLGKIRIADAVYPGVKIVIGGYTKTIREQLRFVTFYVDEGELRTGAYR